MRGAKRSSTVVVTALLVAGLVVDSPAPAHAASMVDQAFEPSSTLAARLETGMTASQPFTAGLTGPLNSVDILLPIPVEPTGSFDVNITAPGGALIASATHEPGASGWTTVDFDGVGEVIAGTRYTLAVTAVSAPVWLRIGTGYEGGEWVSGHAFGFRTYVEVADAAPSIAGVPPAAYVGEEYGFSFDLRGAPHPTVEFTGSVPGLTFAPDGNISGTPTQAGTYDISAIASNSAGTADWEGTITVGASRLPTAPRNFSATLSSGGVLVQWSAPESFGDGTFEHYEITTSTGDVFRTGGTSLIVDSFRFVAGQNIEFTVRAVTTFGTGPGASDSVVWTTWPAAPTGLQAFDFEGTVFLWWNAPIDDGGAPLTGYDVYARESGGSPWMRIGRITSAFETFAYLDELTPGVSALTTGVPYELSVTAVNERGSSDYSDPATAMVLGPPSSPSNLEALAGDRQVTLTWNAPERTSGYPVDYYVISYAAGGTTESRIVDGFTSSTVIDSLTNGAEYTFTVTAVSALGDGDPSQEVTATPFGVPGAPVGLAGVAGDGEVSLTWQAPEDDGGAAVSGYVVQSRVEGDEWSEPDEAVVDGAGAVVSDLVNGTGYEFRVAALNEAGTGAFGEAVSVTPVGEDDDATDDQDDATGDQDDATGDRDDAAGDDASSNDVTTEAPDAVDSALSASGPAAAVEASVVAMILLAVGVVMIGARRRPLAAEGRCGSRL